MQYYKGSPFQRGYGLGGTFRRFFSWIMPIVQKHAMPAIKEVGRTAISTAADIAKDAVSGKDLKESAQERVSAAIDSIKNKAESKLIDGKGIKRKGKKYYIIKKRKHLKDIFD